jgi:hypothetical protein
MTIIKLANISKLSSILFRPMICSPNPTVEIRNLIKVPTSQGNHYLGYTARMVNHSNYYSDL